MLGVLVVVLTVSVPAAAVCELEVSVLLLGAGAGESGLACPQLAEANTTMIHTSFTHLPQLSIG